MRLPEVVVLLVPALVNVSEGRWCMDRNGAMYTREIDCNAEMFNGGTDRKPDSEMREEQVLFQSQAISVAPDMDDEEDDSIPSQAELQKKQKDEQRANEKQLIKKAVAAPLPTAIPKHARTVEPKPPAEDEEEGVSSEQAISAQLDTIAAEAEAKFEKKLNVSLAPLRSHGAEEESNLEEPPPTPTPFYVSPHFNGTLPTTNFPSPSISPPPTPPSSSALTPPPPPLENKTVTPPPPPPPSTTVSTSTTVETTSTATITTTAITTTAITTTAITTTAITTTSITDIPPATIDATPTPKMVIRTYLVSAVKKGQSELPTASHAGFVIGRLVRINAGGTNAETGRIAEFGSIILEDGLEFDHSNNEIVQMLPPNAVMVSRPKAPKEKHSFTTAMLFIAGGAICFGYIGMCVANMMQGKRGVRALPFVDRYLAPKII